MAKVSDYYREIKLKLRSPAEFKFTKGTWETGAIVENNYTKIIISPKENKKYSFKIESFGTY
jgi:hypothetical protein